VCREEDSTVPVEAVAAVVFGFRERAGSSGISMSLLGGAFLQSRAKAMTSWRTGATVCESR
jgi:hypothetical protein